MLKFIILCWILSLIMKPAKSNNRSTSNQSDDDDFEDNFFNGASGRDIDDF